MTGEWVKFVNIEMEFFRTCSNHTHKAPRHTLDKFLVGNAQAVQAVCGGVVGIQRSRPHRGGCT